MEPDAKSPDVRDLPENIRYEIARQNIAATIEEIKSQCGLTDLLTLCAVESVLGAIRSNFGTSAAFQAAQIYGDGLDPNGGDE